jgi:magnesium transporter
MANESIPRDGTGPVFSEPDAPGPDAPTVTESIPPKCPTRTRAYRAGKVVDEGFPADRISEHLDEHEDTRVWLDLRDPDLDDLQIVVQEFGLHPLAVEDAIQDHQRPKLDRYDTHLFVNCYAATLVGDGLLASEVSIFVTPRALITVRKDDRFDIDAVVGRWDSAPQLAPCGIAFLLHGLLDVVADGHLDTVQQIEDRLEDLEDSLFEAEVTPEIRRRGYDARKAVVKLRRLVAPMREVLGGLMREETGLVDRTMRPYYQDVHDHEMRAADSAEGLRDLAASILDSYRNEQSYQLNEVTKKLAGWAAIIAVPTAVTGFYGQNVPYPGYETHWGFVTSTVVMVGLVVLLYRLLRRQDWL